MLSTCRAEHMRKCTCLGPVKLPGVRLFPEALLACQRAAPARRLTVPSTVRGGGTGGGTVGGAGSGVACHARAAGARYCTGCSRGAGTWAVQGLLVARVSRNSAVCAPHGDFNRGRVYPSAHGRLRVYSQTHCSRALHPVIAGPTCGPAATCWQPFSKASQVLLRRAQAYAVQREASAAAEPGAEGSAAAAQPQADAPRGAGAGAGAGAPAAAAAREASTYSEPEWSGAPLGCASPRRSASDASRVAGGNGAG